MKRDDMENFLEKVSLCLGMTGESEFEQREKTPNKHSKYRQGTACAEAGLHLWNSESSGVAGAEGVNGSGEPSGERSKNQIVLSLVHRAPLSIKTAFL